MTFCGNAPRRHARRRAPSNAAAAGARRREGGGGRHAPAEQRLAWPSKRQAQARLPRAKARGHVERPRARHVHRRQQHQQRRPAGRLKPLPRVRRRRQQKPRHGRPTPFARGVFAAPAAGGVAARRANDRAARDTRGEKRRRRRRNAALKAPAGGRASAAAAGGAAAPRARERRRAACSSDGARRAPAAAGRGARTRAWRAAPPSHHRGIAHLGGMAVAACLPTWGIGVVLRRVRLRGIK